VAKACHQSGADRIADRDHDERDGCGRLPDREGSGRSGGYDRVDVQRHEFGNERGKTLVSALSPSVFDQDVPVFDVAEVTQALAKRLDQMGFERRGRVAQEADARQPAPLLRCRRERPKQRTA
jgi:hypothetical protein